MPAAKKRNYNSRPVSREAYDFHNRHSKETWPEVKAKMPRQREAPAVRREIYEEY